MPVNHHPYLLPTDYEGEGDFKAVALWMNRVGTLINNMHFLRGGDVQVTEDWIRLTASPAFQWAKLRFGYSIEGQVVTIKAGTVVRGRNHFDVPETPVTITGGDEATPQIVYLRYKHEQGLSSAEIPTTPVTTAPRPNDTYWQKPLFAYYWTGDMVVRTTIYWMGGDIEATGQFD